MIRKLVPLLLIVVVVAACGKDNFNTKPSLKLKNQSRVVPADNEAIFFVNVEFADKEGDLSGIRDSSIYFQAFLLNVRSVIGGPNYPPAYASLPEFPDKRKGEIELRLDRFAYYKQIQSNQGGNDANDTLVVKIAIKDKAGNVSDTLTSDPIVLLGQ
ncbi:hypothetical protein [Flavihumibacter sp. CACIAM 22H1]|uniref:hypothetical protein n=1 Tax=Flavihumibacter sp. CACIAM 22H1 TaxID=1812911 RepID=UPI000AD10115|nr:hypothetical protein [Flavihumibacter sp. CACIAM 22H1]